MIRLSKIFIAVAIAVFFTVTVINNITDYQKTSLFIQHTLTMDTTAKNPHFMWRAISNDSLHHVLFISIILLQSIIALLCWWGIIQMIRHYQSIPFKFTQAKLPTVLGCSLGFTLYGLGFLTIAGQWFMMRESTFWNVQNSVHTFLTFLGISLIYLSHED